MKFIQFKNRVGIGLIFVCLIVNQGRSETERFEEIRDTIVSKSDPEILTQSLSKIQGKSLKEAFKAAVHRSEVVEIQGEILVQAHEADSQAWGAVLPTLNTSFTFLQQETPRSLTGATIFPATQNTGKLTFDQPLFRGLRDFAALRQRKFLVSAQEGAYLNAAKQLFYDVSTAYYHVIVYQADERNYKIQIELNRKRLVELESFFKIGRSQLTDVLTFKANINSLEAQLEMIRGQLEAAREVLAYLTGWDRSTPLRDQERLFSGPNESGPESEREGSSVPPSAGDVQKYLGKIDQRPDVRLALDQVKANDEGIPIAFGAHLPSLDLIGNYYFFRPGAISDVHWDLQLAVSFPIFQGGVVQSQVRQASSVARQYSLALSQSRRLAEQEIRTFYDAVEADRKQVVKLVELVEVSKKNYETELEYYRRGLVTNLDVFQAMTTYQDAVRQMDHLRVQYYSDGVKLLASSGQRPELNDVEIPKH
jgi:outer membrane protein